MADLTKRSFCIGTHTQLDNHSAFINPEFENRVLSHILGNYMENSPYPLYLAIHGKKGEGKTFQTLRVCSKYNITIYYISGAELCGAYEKDSIATIEDDYLKALQKYKTDKIISAFVIDDFHLSIASTEAGIGRTVNSQILIGYLMNMADKAKASKESRVPIILLANDYANMYGPLTRDGRMDFYEWNPTTEEKKEIVAVHFEDIIDYSQMDMLKKIVMKYDDQPVSFFTEIKNDLLKQQVSDYISKNKKPYIKDMLSDLKKCSISKYSVTEIERKIEILAEERKSTSRSALHEERDGLHAGD